MSYIIFRGIGTQELPGVEVSKMPSHRRGSMRYTEFYVRGRDGALHINEGYANFELEATLVLIDAAPETRQMVNAWATGIGKLILSDDPTKAYKASVLKEIKWSRVRGNSGYFDTARITWNCDPFMVEAEETEITVTTETTFSNPGTEEAYPTIVVNGSGDASFTVNGKQVTVSGMTSGVPVTLDCENGYAFAQSGVMTLTGEFPVFEKGTNTVTPGSGITSLVVTPHWRWV